MIYPEFAENPESRCPVILVLDVSESMDGLPIKELNAGLAAFKYHVEQDEMAALRVELAIVTFGAKVEVLQDFVTVESFTAPQLVTSGRTPLGEALELALKILEDRKQIYKTHGIPYYRPWVFLITDGAPTDGEKWRHAAVALHEAEKGHKLSFYTVAIEGADMEVLQQVASPERPPLKLKDLRFRELFHWLSASLKRASTSKGGLEKINLPAVISWAVEEQRNDVARRP